MAEIAGLLKPKSFEATTLDGEARVFWISRLPATLGREIVAVYPMSALPKIGDYAVNEATMLKMLAHVAVEIAPGNFQRLTTRALVDNHTGDWECLFAVERAMLAYNTSFFQNGKISDIFADIGQNLSRWISKTLTDLLAASSRQGKPPSTN